MRTTSSLVTASATFVAVAALSAATGTATISSASGAAPPDRGDRVTSTRPLSTSGSQALAAMRSARSNSSATRVSTDQSLVVTDALVDSTGATHVRMRRTYDGLRVVGGDLVVHRDAGGSFTGSSQSLDRALTLSTTPTLSSGEARSRVGTAATRAGTPTLVVDATSTTPRLAWLATTTGMQADRTPSRIDTYVDARTGAILRSEQRIQTIDGDGQSLYGGTVPLQLTQTDGTYQLKDPTRGNTFTTDAKNGTDSVLCSLLGSGCIAGTLFTSPDTHFGTGTGASRESAAVDAQYGTNVTWDYYKANFGRNGIFDTGKGSSNRVHYGKNYVNAFWDGSKMTYGDGDGASYGPLTSLDVAGHEMSHGVTENTAGLTYSGESGGLNESTSDIFGTMVEFYAANPQDPGDYLIGEEFDLAKHEGFRRMDNPSSDGASLSCWSSNAKNVDVHYSSGIGNHFFYLLAEGSGSTSIGGVPHSSTTCNGSSVAGIGRSAAAAIWYRALTVYMTSSTDYAGARTATLDAARDLFGTGSAQQSAVAAGWSAVSVS
ncbi:M4 family metallopeptidase [Aeromicrobium sp.]|uniref:M4 family metallopeptidase n=1 Tax=Aeromicrobium sp. TaxID=1871063 RepID=UPI0019AE3FF9|nr:M4 family metallopeptidase [Aeromicrobium sp.]MBC7633686.1 M4 family metallopeptidase [Aeromicrobium sp.]